MRIEEAEWISRTLEGFPGAELDPVLELGSSTLEYRTAHRPYIDRLIHQQLRGRGVRVICSDIKPDEGVDISGDIFDPATFEKLRALRPRLILCNNILPHVADPREFARICDRLLEPGGMMLVSSPESYPFEVDPIDNGFRARPEGLAALFPGYEVRAAESVKSVTFAQELVKRGPREGLRTVLRSLLPFHGMARWKARTHRFLWLLRPYIISAVVLRKPTTSS